MLEVDRCFLREPCLIEADYAAAVLEAQKLLQLPKEAFSFSERKELVSQVIEAIYSGEPDDERGRHKVAEDIIRLLHTYPLSCQQAGVIVRAQRMLGAMQELIGEESERSEISLEELVTIHTGDWKEIVKLFTLSSERTRFWKNSQRRIIRTRLPKTVYRGMWLHEEDVALVQKYGLLPGGLMKYSTPERLINEQIRWWGMRRRTSSDPYSAKHELAKRLPFSTVNVLHEVYLTGEFGFSSEFKLAMSTTTPKNLRTKTGRFFGDNLFRIRLPGNMLIAAKNEGPPEDERTILYYIPPEAITGYCYVP